MLNEVKEYWKKFRGECDELLERDIGGVIAEQIQMTDRILEMLDTIEALQQENERLQVQNGAMREALEEATETIENIYEKDTPQTEKYRDILNVGTTEYHNPADVAEIEKLQAQLESLRCTSCGEIPATIGTDDGQYCEKCAEELDAVEVIDLLSYHNPADMEALRKAREALEKVQWVDNYTGRGRHCKCCAGNPDKGHSDCCKVGQALAAIDKIGGREDV
jgi:seryl-tRNA synthetase